MGEDLDADALGIVALFKALKSKEARRSAYESRLRFPSCTFLVLTVPPDIMVYWINFCPMSGMKYACA